MFLFNIFSKSKVEGDIVDLLLSYKLKGNGKNNNVSYAYYDILLHNTKIKVGKCDLRVGMNDELYYAGNIGYHIYEDFRGNNFAYYACLLLFEIAKKDYKMNEIVITCSPDNIPSFKTCIKLKGILIETVNVPNYHWLYMRNEREKHIFKYKL